MPGIRTETRIAAPPERCWEVLTDFDRYPDWNPFLVRLSRRPPNGAWLWVKSGPISTPLWVRIKRKELPELRWSGNFLTDGLIKGDHYFRLEPQPDGSSLFIHGEDFTGIASPAFWLAQRRIIERGYAAMNTAFKARCEGAKAI